MFRMFKNAAGNPATFFALKGVTLGALTTVWLINPLIKTWLGCYEDDPTNFCQEHTVVVMLASQARLAAFSTLGGWGGYKAGQFFAPPTTAPAESTSAANGSPDEDSSSEEEEQATVQKPKIH